jgi:two-component system sensor histidine kinase MprB
MDVPTRRLRRSLMGSAHPLHRRLTLLTMLAVAVTVVAVCLTGWVALRVTLFNVVAHGNVLIAHDLAPAATQDIAQTGRLSTRELGPGTAVVEAVRADGTVLLTPGEDLTLDVGQPEVAAAQQQQQIVRNTTSSNGETYRIITVPLGQSGDVLVVGRPLTATFQVLDVFGLVVLIVGGFGLLWAWLLGGAVARTALRPLSSFTDTVRHVAETEDLHPVSAGYANGVLATLTDTFNHMLARLAASRDQQNRLVADASHELRTPLTSMRTNLELLALDARTKRLSDPDRAAILDEVQAQTVEFSDLIADLVHLTRENTLTRQPVDLRTVVQKSVDRVRRRGPGLTFDVDLSSVDVLGDAGSLEQAVTNVLDNAVRWSPPGGTIRVRLDGHQLHIADQGTGIAAADLPHIFDRFYRAETARSTPGTGLGLAVTAKAVRDHGGTIHAESPPDGGAHFTIQLPGTFGTTSPGPPAQAVSPRLEEPALAG